MDVEPLLELVDVLLLDIAGNSLDRRVNKRKINLMAESERNCTRVPDKRAALMQELAWSVADIGGGRQDGGEK